MKFPALSPWKTVALALAVAVGAGVATSAIVTSSLSVYAVQLAELTAPLRLSQERPLSLPSDRLQELQTVRAKSLPSVVAFYPTQKNAAAPYAYDPARLLASGAVLTSDGWIAAWLPAGSDVAKMDIVIGGGVYTAERYVFDTSTGASFIHVQVKDAPVLAFGAGEHVAAGEPVYVLPEPGAVVYSTVYRVSDGNGAAQSSDRPSRRWLLSLPSAALGAPIVDASGSLVGMVDGSDSGHVRVLPFTSLLPSFQALLRKNAPTRAALGISTVSLEAAVGAPVGWNRGLQAGARIVKLAVTGAGRASGLAEGDIILAVDGQAVDADHPLDASVASYAPGDTAVFRLDRAGVQQDVRVTFGSSAASAL